MSDQAMQLAFVWPGEERRPDMNGADRELIQAMEARTYRCSQGGTGFHAAHPLKSGEICPGLVKRICGAAGPHTHHRWAELDSFYWCQPYDYLVGRRG